ncbi:MAG: hypothetical protein JNG86_06830 [Verrucomicrobiaceae bacterium]|nr:hypothetical protein [Verrucomicrobiaceae bacterium]
MFAIIRRTMRGVSIFNADAEHIHHRLILLGYSKGRALVAMYSVCVVLSLVGISILLTKGIALPVAGALLFLLAIMAARYLGYIRSFSRLRDQIREALERRRQREYFRARGRILDFEVERSATLEEFGSVLRHALGRMNVSLVPSEQLEPLDLTLSTGAKVVLHHPRDQEPLAEWHVRLDQLAPSLEACLVRWQRLPDGIGDTPPRKATADDEASSPKTATQPA